MELYKVFPLSGLTSLVYIVGVSLSLYNTVGVLDNDLPLRYNYNCTKVTTIPKGLSSQLYVKIPSNSYYFGYNRIIVTV